MRTLAFSVNLGRYFFPGNFFLGEGIRKCERQNQAGVFSGLAWASSGSQWIHQKFSVAFSETSIAGGPQGPNSFFSNDRAPCEVRYVRRSGPGGPAAGVAAS